MSDSERHAEPAHDPTPISGEWLAIGIFVRAHVRSMPKARRKVFLRECDVMVEAFAQSLAATPIKRSARGRARLEAMHEAVAWYRAARPYLLA